MKKIGFVLICLSLLFSNVVFSADLNLDDQKYENAAAIALLEGKYQDAIALFDKAILISPQKARLYMNRAGAYTLSQQHDLALLDYNKAVQLEPEFAGGYYSRGFFTKIRSKILRWR